MRKLVYIVDIDGTILEGKPGEYPTSKPLPGRIEKINALYDQGHTIIYWTARGATSGIDWTYFTKTQLDLLGCKYTELRMHKPHYDIWVDDKAVNALDFFSN